MPIHPELRNALLSGGPGHPGARVFATAVTNVTRRRDFERAGIRLVDEEGRHADGHGLRGSLHTRLAREGVPVQIAQRIMRHADYRTTLAAYTCLELVDDADAIARIATPTSTPTTKGTNRCELVPQPAKSQPRQRGWLSRRNRLDLQRLATQCDSARRARPPGFEPGTVGLEVRCSIQLSYGRLGVQASVHRAVLHGPEGGRPGGRFSVRRGRAAGLRCLHAPLRSLWSRALSPESSRRLTSAPASSRARTIASRPLRAALINGVPPQWLA